VIGTAYFRKIEIKDLSPASVVARAPPSPAPVANGENWVSLFNGRDLSGWKAHPSDTAKWEVVGGILRASGGGGQLFTERDDYENFHFRVEAQINDVGNSGQYFRAVFGPNPAIGYEAQISTSQADQKTGSLYGLVKIPQALHKPNEWFTQEVIANGDRISITVNGKQVVSFVDPNNTYTRGHLALQQNLPGSVVQFRKIEVKELASASTGAAASAAAGAENSEREIQAGIARLQKLLVEESWTYSDSLYPPGDRAKFYSNGTFHRYKWRYWVIGPRTMHIQFSSKPHNPETAIELTFNEQLTQGTGKFGEAKRGVHRLTLTREAHEIERNAALPQRAPLSELPDHTGPQWPDVSKVVTGPWFLRFLEPAPAG
jgi:hypothetical protein